MPCAVTKAIYWDYESPAQTFKSSFGMKKCIVFKNNVKFTPGVSSHNNLQVLAINLPYCGYEGMSTSSLVSLSRKLRNAKSIHNSCINASQS